MTVHGGEHDRQDAWTLASVLSNLVGVRLLDRRLELASEDVGVAMSTIEERALQRIADGRWRVKVRERKPAQRLELQVGAEDADRPANPAQTTRDPMTALREPRRTSRSADRDPGLSGRGAMRAQCRDVADSHDPSTGLKRFAGRLAHNVGIDRLRGARHWISYVPVPDSAAAESASQRDWWAELAAAIDTLDEPARSVARVRLELGAQGWPQVVAELDRRGVRNSAGAPFSAVAARKLLSRLAHTQPLFGLLVNTYRSGESRATFEAAERDEQARAAERRQARVRARQAARLLRDEDHELYVLLWARMTEGTRRSGEQYASDFLGRHVPRQELLRRVAGFSSGLDELAARQLPLIELARPRRLRG